MPTPTPLRPAFLCALLWATAAAAEPLAVRDPNPLTRAAYLPLPATAAPAGGWQLDAQLTWSNTVNLGANAREQLLVDAESTELTLAVTREVGGWQLRASVPVVHRSAGALDGFIDGWHRAFGLPQGDRPNRPRNAYALRYQRAGLAPVDVPEGSSLGDVALEAGHVLVAGPRATLSGWVGLEAPTGSRTALTGNGAWDAATWLALEAQLAPRWTASGRAGWSHSSGDGLLPLAREVGFGTAALSWRATQSLEAVVQIDAHTALVRGSDLPFLSEAVELTLGGRYRLRSGAVIEAGVVEDIQVNHSPDVAFVLGFKWAQAR
jgi:hypothetical protein